MTRVLVVEDDRELGEQVVRKLRAEQYEVEWLREGRVLADAEVARFDVVVLDLMLPGVYGLDILKDLRKRSEVPVLVLSARSDADDKVRALKLGADDYMTKPFWPEELVERVRARLRRPALVQSDRLVCGALCVDVPSRTVAVDGAPAELTRLEFDLLLALVRRQGHAVSRAWLIEHVLDQERVSSERVLDAHVSRLRKKLGPRAGLETVWGIGYRLGATSK